MRNITVTLDDGSTHVYQNAPDDITPDRVEARAKTDFGKSVKSLDGGKAGTPVSAPSVNEMEDAPQPANSSQSPSLRQTPILPVFGQGNGDYRSQVEAGIKARMAGKPFNANYQGGIDTMGATPRSGVLGIVQPTIGPKVDLTGSNPSGNKFFPNPANIQANLDLINKPPGNDLTTRFGQGLADIGVGGTQLAGNAVASLSKYLLPNSAGSTIDSLRDSLNSKLSSFDESIQNDRLRAAQARIGAHLRDPEFVKLTQSDPQRAQAILDQEMPGTDWARAIGGLIGFGGAGSKVAEKLLPDLNKITNPLIRIPGKMAAGAAGGEAANLVSPVNTNQQDYERAKMQGAIPAALAGVAGTAIGGATGRILNPKTPQNVTTLLNNNIIPTVGHAIGGFAKNAEDALTSQPILGSAIRSGQDRAIGELNTAALGRALTPVGESLPKGMVGRDAIAHVQDTLGQKYDDVLNKIGNVKPDAQLDADISQAAKDHLANMKTDTVDQFNRIVENEITGRMKNGELSGDSIKAAESNLGKTANGYSIHGDYDQKQLAQALNDTRDALREMLTRTSPANAKELANINLGYANFKIAQRASGMLGAPEGVFNPNQLQNAVSANSKRSSGSSFARGDALMQDLSEPAQAVLSSKLANSGTADRLLMAEFARNPLLAAGKASLSAIPGIAYTPWGQQALVSAIGRRTPGMRSLGDMVSNASQGSIPFAAGGSPLAPTLADLLMRQPPEQQQR